MFELGKENLTRFEVKTREKMKVLEGRGKGIELISNPEIGESHIVERGSKYPPYHFEHPKSCPTHDSFGRV